MVAATYDDGMEEFECVVLACSVNGFQYLILDTDTNEREWCCDHHVIIDDEV